MNKKAVIDLKLKAVMTLQDEMAIIENLETHKLYMFGQGESKIWGYIETFNAESFKVRVLAANDGNYSDQPAQYWRKKYQRNITRYGYQYCQITPCKREDIPLLIRRP